jgi:hypothetical protein
MADIKQAAEWMDAGLKVCRPKEEDDGIWSATDIGGFVERNNRDRAMLQTEDILADDWEIAS